MYISKICQKKSLQVSFLVLAITGDPSFVTFKVSHLAQVYQTSQRFLEVKNPSWQKAAGAFSGRCWTGGGAWLEMGRRSGTKISQLPYLLQPGTPRPTIYIHGWLSIGWWFPNLCIENGWKITMSIHWNKWLAERGSRWYWRCPTLWSKNCLGRKPFGWEPYSKPQTSCMVYAMQGKTHPQTSRL